MERSKAIIGEKGRFNENLMVWRDLPGNRILEFGGVKDESDVSKWRGRAHDGLFYDELTEFTRTQFVYLTAWARSTVKGQKTRIVAAFNPPSSSEGMWVIDYFAAWLDDRHPNPAVPGELRWYASVDGREIECKNGEPFQHNGETVRPKSRTFFPARLADNPYLAETSYGATLQSLPEPMRSQLLYGDFKALVQDDAYQVIPTAWVKEAMKRWKDTPRPVQTPTFITVDCSRGGDDQSVICKRYDNWIDNLIKYPGSQITDGQTLVQKLIPHLDGGVTAGIDVIGIGASAYDIARMNHLSVIGINWTEKTLDHERDKSGRLRFVNKRAKDWWRCREALDPNSGENICLPDDPELLADLTAPRWEVQARGIRVEAKEDIKKRIGRSPDCGDAVVMQFGSNGASAQMWIDYMVGETYKEPVRENALADFFNKYRDELTVPKEDVRKPMVMG